MLRDKYKYTDIDIDIDIEKVKVKDLIFLKYFVFVIILRHLENFYKPKEKQRLKLVKCGYPKLLFT